MKRLCLTVVAVLSIAVCIAAAARDLGVRGAVWAPVEADLLESIEAELVELERSGESGRLNEEAAARARERIEAPEPVAGIAAATADRTRWFDPSIAVGEDILGPGGAVIAAAGTRVNPLLYRPLTGSLLFIDGTRPVEVRWALEEATPSKIVLLAGRPLELARTHGRTFYFDQAGALTDRFGLSATPSRITQHESLLRIDEIVLRTAEVLRTADQPLGTADPLRGADPLLEAPGEDRIITDEKEPSHDPIR